MSTTTMLRFVVFLSCALSAFGQCLYTPTECQCSVKPAGDLCLRYSTTELGQDKCQVYECGSGYVCDCAGPEVCDITDCTATRDVYRPSSVGPSFVGEIIDCQLATQVNCVTPRVAAISSTPSPSASMSQAATPTASASMMPSTSPSASMSQAATPTASASMMPSTSPSASMSASASPTATTSMTPSMSPSASMSASASPTATTSMTPSMSPSASMSASASPIPSVTPSATTTPTPSSSPSASASYSSTPSASASYSSTPSPTPSTSAGPAPLGSPCTTDSDCVAGAGCSCTGTCKTLVNLSVSGLGDDNLEVFVCGNSLGAATTFYTHTGTWSYSGTCEDVYLFSDNFFGGHTGTIAVVIDTDTNTQYPLTFDASGNPTLSALVGHSGWVTDPNDLSFFTDPSYDFIGNNWAVPVLAPHLEGNSNYQSFMSTYGTRVMAHAAGFQGNGAQGHNYFRLVLPLC